MVPLAIGTQTGIVIRPASYCGCLPQHFRTSFTGVKPLSQRYPRMFCQVRRGSSDLQAGHLEYCWGGSANKNFLKSDYAAHRTGKRLAFRKMPWNMPGKAGAARSGNHRCSTSGRIFCPGDAHGCIMVYEAGQNLRYELSHHQSLLSKSSGPISKSPSVLTNTRRH